MCALVSMIPLGSIIVPLPEIYLEDPLAELVHIMFTSAARIFVALAAMSGFCVYIFSTT